MFIRPATIPEGVEGAGARYRVRDPVTHQFLAENGEKKPASDYWLRRLVDGGVEEAVPPVEAEKHDADPAPGEAEVGETLLIKHEGGAS